MIRNAAGCSQAQRNPQKGYPHVLASSSWCGLVGSSGMQGRPVAGLKSYYITTRDHHQWNCMRHRPLLCNADNNSHKFIIMQFISDTCIQVQVHIICIGKHKKRLKRCYFVQIPPPNLTPFLTNQILQFRSAEHALLN